MHLKIFLLGIVLSSFLPKLNSQLLVPYKVGNKWGFADTTGVLKIQPIYDEVEFFEKGISIVSRNGKRGCINTLGKTVVETDYNELWSINRGEAYIVAKNSGYGLIKMENNAVKEILPLTFSSIKYNEKGVFQCVNSGIDTIYYDIHGVSKSTNDFTIDSKEIKRSSGKSYPYFKTYQENNKVGFIRVNYMNTKDTLFKAGLYDALDDLLSADDMYIVKKEDKYGVVNSKNDMILDFKFDQIDSELTNYLGRKKTINLFLVVREGRKWGVVGVSTLMNRKNGISSISRNSDSEQEFYVVLDCIYDSIKYTDNRLYFLVKKGDMQGIVNTRNYKLLIGLKDAIISEHVVSMDNFKVFEVSNVNGDKYFVGENGVEYYKE